MVLNFHPKDDTSGCTGEARDLSAEPAVFQAAGAIPIGVLKESIDRHDRFVKKHGLDITFVSDAGGNLCEQYGRRVEKSMYGRRYMGIEPATFLIDTDPVVRRYWRKVKVAGHVAETPAGVRALSEPFCSAPP